MADSSRQSKTITFLEKILDSDDFPLISFKENVKQNYKHSVIKGLGILESIIEDISDGNFNPKETPILNNCSKQLRNFK